MLDLTPDQEKLWSPFEAAARDAAKESADRANKLRNTPEPTSVVELLGIVADHELARAQALKFVTALQPLAASLTAGTETLRSHIPWPQRAGSARSEQRGSLDL